MSREMATPESNQAGWKRLWPILILATGFGAFFGLGLNDYMSFDSLRENRQLLLAWVDARPLAAVLIFIFTYATLVACSLPGGLFFTLTGAFLFGHIWGTVWSVIGATIGAALIFIAARTAFADFLHRKAGPFLLKLEEGFQRDAFSYLLGLRLVPIFPFWLVNLAPAFLGVNMRSFVAATFIGMIPATFVYSTFGAELGSYFDDGKVFTVGNVLTPQVIAALGALAALSLLPILFKYLRSRGAGAAQATPPPD